MEKQAGGGEDHLFLGEPEWESLPGGRVRCVQTGHEMPLAAQPTYALTKKCRSALFDAALKKRTPPLNSFDQSPVAKDKIICKLTGVVLNKKEDAVWRHMLGKKFEQKLAEKEAEKESARKDVEMTEQVVDKPGSEVAMNNGRATKKERASAPVVPQEANGKGEAAEEEEEAEANDSDNSDFWVPPAGQRWDFDAGGDDRWALPPQDDPDSTPAQIAEHISDPTALESRSFPSNDGDTEMLDGKETLHDGGSSDDSEDVKIRTKRTSAATKSRSQKKKAKRLKPESMKQNGF